MDVALFRQALASFLGDDGYWKLVLSLNSGADAVLAGSGMGPVRLGSPRVGDQRTRVTSGTQGLLGAWGGTAARDGQGGRTSRMRCCSITS